MAYNLLQTLTNKSTYKHITNDKLFGVILCCEGFGVGCVSVIWALEKYAFIQYGGNEKSLLSGDEKQIRQFHKVMHTMIIHRTPYPHTFVLITTLIGSIIHSIKSQYTISSMIPVVIKLMMIVMFISRYDGIKAIYYNDSDNADIKNIKYEIKSVNSAHKVGYIMWPLSLLSQLYSFYSL